MDGEHGNGRHRSRKVPGKETGLLKVCLKMLSTAGSVKGRLAEVGVAKERSNGALF